jgi:hypothetical protein
MASLIVAGNTSGSVTISAPDVASTPTLTLPTVSGTILTTASSGQSIPKAALPTGSVLQVIQATTSSIITTNSTSFVTSGLSLSITPTSSTSKVLVMLIGGGAYNGAAGASVYTTIYRGSTDLGYSTYGLERLYSGSSTAILSPHSAMVLDSPSTTSSTTYTAYFKSSSGGATVNFSYNDGGITTLIAMEIAA